MSLDDLERRLAEAFDMQARAEVSDTANPPAPRYLEPRRHHRARVLAPLAAAAVTALVVLGSLFAVRDRPDHHRAPIATSRPVRMEVVTTAKSYGVGMPVVAYFSQQFRSAKPLAAATAVTVDGKPVQAAWYFQRSAARGYPVEGHLRMRSYWPAHADVRVAIARNTITSAATIEFHTGAQTIALVFDSKHRMVVTSDGKQLGSYPVSLGMAGYPTSRGTKVIMTKEIETRLRGPGYDHIVHYCQQLTDTGEYLLASPWHKASIVTGTDSSLGGTDLLPRDARHLYRILQVGDVVRYPDANGPQMTMETGLGDWNVSWRVWLTGGLIPTS